MSRMRISIFKGTAAHEMVMVDSVKGVTPSILKKLICEYAWAAAVFEGNQRSNANVRGVDFIALDIDGDLTIEDAKERIRENGFSAVIGTTRNHQRPKRVGNRSLKACDRFRIIFPLSETVVNDDDFKATWSKVVELFPESDPACKDAARFFWPCKEVVASFKGKKVQVCLSKSWSGLKTEPSSKISSSGTRGNLSKATLNFIARGAPVGQWHNRFFKAATDLKEQGYSRTEAQVFLSKATGTLDKEDLYQLKDIYQRGSKYPPRLPQKAGSTEQRDEESERETPIYEPLNSEEQKIQLRKDRRVRDIALRHKLPFICAAFDGVFDLTMGLTAIGGCTGKGKTTTNANILAHFTLHSSKKALVVSNEESMDDIFGRTACVLLKQPFMQYRRGELKSTLRKPIELLVDKLTEKIEVVSFGHKKLETTRLEHVVSVFKRAAKERGRYGLIILDYLQTITDADDGANTVEISKRLGTYLKKYGAKVPVPVIVFVQLRPSSEAQDFASRVQNDRTVVNHAAAAIEVISDFESRTTRFKFHKDRFGEAGGKEIEVDFVDGRYEPISASGWGQAKPTATSSSGSEDEENEKDFDSGGPSYEDM